MQQSVSVVIVNFNGGPLLSECVQSVLDSTVPVEVLGIEFVEFTTTVP